jgi:hypothetical protein
VKHGGVQRFISLIILFAASCSLGFIANSVLVSQYSDQLFKTHYPVIVGLLLSFGWLLCASRIKSKKSSFAFGAFSGLVVGAPSVYLTYVTRYLMEGIVEKSFGNIIKSGGWVILHYQIASIFMLAPLIGAASFFIEFWSNEQLRSLGRFP